MKMLVTTLILSVMLGSISSTAYAGPRHRKTSVVVVPVTGPFTNGIIVIRKR